MLFGRDYTNQCSVLGQHWECAHLERHSFFLFQETLTRDSVPPVPRNDLCRMADAIQSTDMPPQVLFLCAYMGLGFATACLQIAPCACMLQ